MLRFWKTPEERQREQRSIEILAQDNMFSELSKAMLPERLVAKIFKWIKVEAAIGRLNSEYLRELAKDIQELSEKAKTRERIDAHISKDIYPFN